MLLAVERCKDGESSVFFVKAVESSFACSRSVTEATFFLEPPMVPSFFVDAGVVVADSLCLSFAVDLGGRAFGVGLIVPSSSEVPSSD